MALHDDSVIGASMPAALVAQAKRFIEANRELLLEYWEGKIPTDGQSHDRRRLAPLSECGDYALEGRSPCGRAWCAEVRRREQSENITERIHVSDRRTPFWQECPLGG
jgi:hypothetical protein